MSDIKKRISGYKQNIKLLSEQLKGQEEGSRRYKKTQGRISRTKRAIKDLQTTIRSQLDDVRNQIANLDARSVDQYKGYSTEINKGNNVSWADIIGLVHSTRTHYKAIELSNGSYYALGASNRHHIIDILTKSHKVLERRDIAITGSDTDIQEELVYINPDHVILHNIPKKKAPTAKLVRKGKFFKYTHNMSIDLTRYQIYSEINDESNKTNCFIHAMIQSGSFDDIKIKQAMNMIKTPLIPLTKMREIADKLDIHIEIYTDGENKIHYNSDSDNHIKLCLFDDHYFLDDNKTNITSYALEHYFEIKDIDRFNQITMVRSDGYYQRRSDRNISSGKLVRFLLENKDIYLNEIVEKSFESNYDEPVEIDDLEYDSDCQFIEFHDKRDLDNDKWNHLYLDFEACTVDKNGNNLAYHIPYQVNGKYVEGGSNKLLWQVTFTGEDCGLKILSKITKNTVIFAHNMKYDINFLFKYTLNDRTCERNGQFITGDSLFYNMQTQNRYKLIYRDTFHMISKSLKEFPKMFQLPEMQKEVISYKIYTPTSINEPDYPIRLALDKLTSSNDMIVMLENIFKWNLVTRPGYFDHMKYSAIYCKQDVNIMYEGYQVFKRWMQEITGLNIMNYSTISSIAYDYTVKAGCFEGCFNITGTPRLFIDQCVVGGRCMTSENKMHHIKDVPIQALDGVALYPSSMYRQGFLKGIPKVLETQDYEIIRNYDSYFIEINVNKVGIMRKFPLLSRIDSNGVRQFSNDLLGVHYVDKVSLEDLIEYHQIEFEIIRGYYFDEGRNNTIRLVIKDLFDNRVQKKKEGNPIQEVYKLIMNSIYGRTLLKYDEKQIRYVRSKEPHFTYLCRNFEYIDNWNKIEGADKYRVQSFKTVDEHFSAPHIGCEVLSMSKRIMNEVMGLADDLKINIYLTDTDSMHIDDHSIKLLQEEYLDKYGRDLIGKNLGQFHPDFDYETDEGFGLPYAVELIAVGKKTYVDKIKVGDDRFKYHIRMKAIPSRCIDDTIKCLYDNDPIKLYEDLYNHNKVNFDLLCDNKVMFKFGHNFTVKNRDQFTRSIIF